MSTPEQRLRNTGVQLPVPPIPLGRYVPLVVSGGLVFLSGMLPVRDGTPCFAGKLGASLDVETGREATRLATLNALAVVRGYFGSLDLIQRVVRLAVYLRSAEDFTGHPRVADAASELFGEIFGDDNGHARLVFGVSSLPAGMCVELDLVLSLHEGPRLAGL